MKIQACNLSLYSKMYSFKSSVSNSSPKILQDKLPNQKLYADCGNPLVDWNKRDELQKEYNDKLLEACFDENKKIDPRLVDYLDNTEFEIEDSNGKVRKMTVGEALKDSIREIVPHRGSLYHATESTDIARKIIKEGFDPLKISRTKIGPGIYCTTSEGHALEYSRAVLSYDYEGNCAYVQREFFDRVKCHNVISSICDYVGIDTSSYPLGSDAYMVAGKMLNEYVRNYLVNELGVDMAKGQTSYSEFSTVIFNLDKVSNLKLKD